MTNVDRLHKESKEKLTRLEENVKMKSLEFKDVEHNLMSEPSKNMIITQFVKDYEASLLSIFKDKKGVFMNFDEFSQVLFEIHFTLFDPKVISDDNIDIKKKNDEIKLLNEAWKFLKDNDRSIETVDSNRIVVFCAAVLGLYKRDSNIEKGEETKDKDKKNSVKGGNSKINSPIKHQENKVLLIEENLLIKVMSEVDFNLNSFSKELTKHLKIYFRYFCEKRIDHLRLEKNKYYSLKIKSDLVNKDLIFKTVLSPVSQCAADNYRKRCFDEVQTESNKSPLDIGKNKLHEAYVLQRKKKDQ